MIHFTGFSYTGVSSVLKSRRSRTGISGTGFVWSSTCAEFNDMEDTEDMQDVNYNTGTEQVEIQAVIFPPYQTLAPGFDFVLDPPGSLFDMSG